MKTTLALLALFISGCATIKGAYSGYGEAGYDCDTSRFATLSEAQVECLEKKGVIDERVVARRAEIERKKAERWQAMLDSVWFIRQVASPAGGIVKGENGLPEEIFKEKIAKFCADHRLDSWDVLEINQSQEFLGTTGGGSSYCSKFGCSGSSRSVARYAYYNELTFTCKSGGARTPTAKSK